MTRSARIVGLACVALLATLHVGSPATVAAPVEDLAVADRAAPQPTSDSPEDVLRRARNKHFDGPWGRIITDSTRGRLINFCFGPAPELPIKTSTTIVLAEVQRAAAFVSDDERQLYSEYALRVERVVMDVSPNAAKLAVLAPGDAIDALRWGGGLRLPSGEVGPFRVAGLHQPQIGQSYVFFLTRVPAIGAFTITTAYLVKDATVQSLDSAHYPQITDKPLEMFLQEIEAEVGTTGQP